MSTLGRDESATQTASYYLHEPLDAGATACELLEGSGLEQCTGVGGAVAVGSATPSEVTALRSQLGLQSGESSFHATLLCSRVLVPQARTVDFKCGASMLASPAPGSIETAFWSVARRQSLSRCLTRR